MVTAGSAHSACWAAAKSSLANFLFCGFTDEPNRKSPPASITGSGRGLSEGGGGGRGRGDQRGIDAAVSVDDFVIIRLDAYLTFLVD
mmetsp:Transcript_24237/g.35616  ORF Transcript_24237/g.35616 Transcript_24237/m.35616 type:complete len:87 (+) Transcript_24237:382-642(+)